MKQIKTFESSLNETASSIKVVKKALPGVKINDASDSIEFDPEEGYKSVESYYITVPGMGGDYCEDDLYLNVYDGDSFCFFYDSAPVPTSLHSSSDVNHMHSVQTEVPLPLSNLNKKIFDEVVNQIKKEMFETDSSMGSKSKKFTDVMDNWNWFVDAEDNEDKKKLPEAWYSALKTLNIKDNDALVCFFDDGDMQEVLDAARENGLKFIQIEEKDTEERVSNGGIVFSSKQ